MSEMYIPRGKLLKASNGSIYELTILLAKRALELADGDAPLVDHPETKVLENAFREVLEDKIIVKVSRKK
ncbi:MAG: DNA-directed RNA polymerase subunit omega [Candidatus Omnitrophota bacterium]|nr:DNA-directed RNA polymerase subunit omega [Candidatus Omnitrophota bacterium]